MQGNAANLSGFCLEVYFYSFAPADTGFAHAPGNYGSVTGHAAPGSKNAHSLNYAMYIIRSSFGTDQNNLFPFPAPGFRFIRIKDDNAAARPRRCRQPRGNDLHFGIGGNLTVKEGPQLAGVNSQQSKLFVDQPFGNHIHGYLDRSSGSALAGPGLEHKESALFNGKLNVLHILVMAFQLLADAVELFRGDWHQPC